MTAALPFDPRRVRAHRARAAEAFDGFLHARVAADLAERLEAVNRSFGGALCVGGGDAFAEAVDARPALKERVGPLISMDVSACFVRAPWGIVGDAEHLPIAEGVLGLYASVLSLHWANDLVGAFVQARRALRPDGLFLASFFGGSTLHELRTSLLQAESELRGGAGLRVAPFAEVVDVAGLLQRAGFALPAADRDVIMVRYAEPLKLLSDLRAMGETSALREQSPPLTRAILLRAAEIYREQFSQADGRVTATFEIITATGWAPHESQQKPLKPGSAKTRLADALGVKEQNAGEKAGG